MGQKDIISKQLIQRIAVDLAVYLLGLNIEYDALDLINTEQQRIEDRRADLVARVTQKHKTFILHIEIQNNNDSLMAARMLRYYTDIGLASPNCPIHQYVIYIGKAKINMPANIQDIRLNYHCNMIDMHQSTIKNSCITIALMC